MEFSDTSLSRSGEVARDEALHSSGFSSAYSNLLVLDEPCDYGADKDVDASKSFRELLNAVLEVPNADLNT